MKTATLLRRIAWSASFLLAVAVLLWTMAATSAWIVRGELNRDARQRLWLLQHDEPLWRWSPRYPQDLVSGHAFGKAHLLVGVDGLDSVSGDGSPFDLGLPLTHPVDLHHWSTLLIHAKSSSPGRLGLSWETPEQKGCLIADVAELSTHSNEIRVDLGHLQALSSDSAHPLCQLPQVATMLRLRPIIPAGASWLLKDVTLQAGMPIPPPATASLMLEGSVAQARQQLANWHAEQAAPRIRLPTGASAEQALTLRDDILARQPGAIIATDNQTLTPSPRLTWLPWLGWAGCMLYLATLLFAAQYRTRESIALALIVLGPLWLIIGLQWQLHPSIPAIIGFVGALGFAAWREWHLPRPVTWRWFGPDKNGWLWPLGLVIVAYVMVLAVDGHHLRPLPWRHVLIYLVWASLQQWLILVVVMRRWEQWRWPSALCVLVTALTFALLHTPNGLLMQMCFLAELYWAWCFLRTRSLAPIAIAHAACALIVEAGLAGPVLRSLEVSGRFFL
ncbi:type II CAAX endopeptidase family protein [Dyella sp.]|uniref:CPBP family intramembrane glutamic endopeptidase n=1 Tax=Dyella sp. TaxID=1869338 RepID=UPI002ED4E183